MPGSGICQLEVFEADNRRWDELAAGADHPEPLCGRGYLAAAAMGADADARPVLVAAKAEDWEATYALVLTPLANGRFLARTPDYGGPVLAIHGVPAAEAAAQFRRELDLLLPRLGVVSEVILVGPFLPHRADVSRAWSCGPEKQICITNLHMPAGERWPPLSHGPRQDMAHARRHLETSWAPLDEAAAKEFAAAYDAHMCSLGAEPRWRVGSRPFLAIAASDTGAWISSARGETGGAAAIYVVGGTRAVLLKATRWGSARGAPRLAHAAAHDGLAALGVGEANLGGGVTQAADDSLLQFKRTMATAEATILLGARSYDPAGHQQAVDAGLARTLPPVAVAV